MWGKPAERLVRLLVTQEVGAHQDNLIAASERVIAKFGNQLSTMIGREGFRSLLKRALTLTTRQYPSFKDVSIAPDGSLGGLDEADSGDGAGTLALLNHIFDLLDTFIGNELTVRMAGVVWPELDLSASVGVETELQ